MRTQVAVIRAAEPVRRKISECIALLPADSTATIDPDFAKDVEAAIAPIESRWSRHLGLMLDSTAAVAWKTGSAKTYDRRYGRAAHD